LQRNSPYQRETAELTYNAIINGDASIDGNPFSDFCHGLLEAAKKSLTLDEFQKRLENYEELVQLRCRCNPQNTATTMTGAIFNKCPFCCKKFMENGGELDA